MTLDEAIAIAKKVYEDESADAQGRKDYKQISEWLEELKQYREKNQAAIKGMETNLDHHLHEILKHAVKAMLRDFVQQVVNLSESLEGAEMEETED